MISGNKLRIEKNKTRGFQHPEGKARSFKKLKSIKGPIGPTDPFGPIDPLIGNKEFGIHFRIGSGLFENEPKESPNQALTMLDASCRISQAARIMFSLGGSA